MSRRPHDPRRTALWRRVRVLVLERDQYRCQLRISPRCTGRAEVADHVIPIAEGGSPYDPANCQASCVVCNGTKEIRRRRTSPSREW